MQQRVRGMALPPEITRLTETFERHREAYHAGRYSEAQLRQEYVNPFFKALGWDVDNTRGWAEAYKDVIHEDVIRVGSSVKAPDYCFRIGGTRKFFVEAKAPSVNLKEDPEPVYQLRRYAWSAKLPLSILTDFDEFAVYDCRVRPHQADKPSKARTQYWRCTDYADHWDEIASIFSYDAVLKGSFDKYATSEKRRRGTAEVDAAFLAEIETWRDNLAHNIALRNGALTNRQLNYAVQITIDRIIFLRICEDRGVERYGQLIALLNGPEVYPCLMALFRQADDRYNSGLFHFLPEKDRPEGPDELTPELVIDDKPLKDILRSLYYPESPYEFSVLPAEILGQVYEQFLGKVIILTAGHHARVEDKPEVKKAGGVFYTPAYIVDYIVQQTVGKLLEGRTVLSYKTKPPRLDRPLRVLDPACGSGSFLLGAYQQLLDWHRAYYEQHDPETWAATKVPPIYQASTRGWRLTLAERKRILLDHIFGVDIDPQAVEVTKLSLLLRVLEGEKNLVLFHNERALPDLAGNIKCGNSLIGPDFYTGQQLTFDEEERFRINAFDWHTGFPEPFKDGGFDVVIGNPPWGASFTDKELEYLRRAYRRVIARMIDSYIYFVDHAFRIVKNDGIVGLIIPSTVLNQVDARPVRKLLLDRGLSAVISLGQGVFGNKVLNTSTVFVSPSRIQHDLIIGDVSLLPSAERPAALQSAISAEWTHWYDMVCRDPHLTFFVSDPGATGLLDLLRERHESLEKIIRGTIQRGVSPDVVEAHVISRVAAKAERLEAELLRPSASGAQIKRYQPWACDQLLIYTSKGTQIETYPRVYGYLKRFKHLNSCREVAEGKHPWWALHRPRDPQIFASPKLIGLTTSKKIELVYDESASAYVTDAMYVFSLLDGNDPWACMGVLQSRLFLFLYRVANQGESRVIPQVKASKLLSLPYPSAARSNSAWTNLSELGRRMLVLQRLMAAAKTPTEKESLQRQMAATDAQIDQLVYELYGLTDDEIDTVEEATTKISSN